MAESGVIRMNVDEWIAVPDCPRQRDTVRHAASAVRGHLANTSPTQTQVQAASIRGEIVCKLDGHTRAYLWASGDLPRPSQKLIVVVHPVKSLAEACELYTHIDDVRAAEFAVDRVSGACRESGVSLHSPLLKHMRLATSLRMAHGMGKSAAKVSEYQLVKEWKDELLILDGWNLTCLHSGLTAVALLAIRRCLVKDQPIEPVRDFFVRFCSDAGVKEGKRRDAVQALSDHMAVRRASKTVTGAANNIDIAERGLSCLNAHLAGKDCVQSIRRTPLSTFAD